MYILIAALTAAAITASLWKWRIGTILYIFVMQFLKKKESPMTGIFQIPSRIPKPHNVTVTIKDGEKSYQTLLPYSFRMKHLQGICVVLVPKASRSVKGIDITMPPGFIYPFKASQLGGDHYRVAKGGKIFRTRDAPGDLLSNDFILLDEETLDD